MWILPKQLISAFVPGTEVLTLDSSEASKACEQSLMRRSKPSLAKCYSREWKAGNLMRLRSGVISSHSLGQSFEDWWTSSLAATHASHSQPQDFAEERKTQGICGPISQMELDLCVPDSASLKTSKDTSRWDSPQSSVTWRSWVIECRGEYSQRLKLAQLTNGNGCSSWPTATARDLKGPNSENSIFRKDGKSRAMDTLDNAVATVATWPTPTVAEAGKIGNQANHGQLALSNHPALRGEVTREKFQKGRHGQAAPDNPNTDGSRQELWLTPRANEPASDSNFVTRNADRGEHCHGSLGSQMKAWATPRAEMDSGAHRGRPDTLHSQMKTQSSGKLNPRWVETLMGLPIGWVMPSCTSPVIIGQTNLDS